MRCVRGGVPSQRRHQARSYACCHCVAGNSLCSRDILAGVHRRGMSHLVKAHECDPRHDESPSRELRRIKSLLQEQPCEDDREQYLSEADELG